MVDDDIFSFESAKGVIAAAAVHFPGLALVFIAHAETEIANNDIIATKRHGIIS